MTLDEPSVAGKGQQESGNQRPNGRRDTHAPLGPMVVGFIFQLMGFATKGALPGDTEAVYIAVGLLSPGAYLLSILPLIAMHRALNAYYRSLDQ